MYFGTQEIDKIDNQTVLLKNGNSINIEEVNKELFTKEPIQASELQGKWAQMIAGDIIDVLHKHNARLTDLNGIITIVNDIITGKNEEAVVKAFGKDKLDVLTSIFGAKEAIPSLSVRNIRMKDIFKS